MTSTHIPGKGVFLDDVVVAFYFRLGLAELSRAGLEGGRASRPLREAQEALRAAMQELAMSSNGQGRHALADMAAGSEASGLLSTQQAADRVGVSARHVRRLAARAGVEPVARDAWDTADVNRLRSLR